LRPTRISLFAVPLLGAGLLGAGWLVHQPRGAQANLAPLASAVGTMACGLLLLAIASRWLGNRLGTLAALAWFGSAAVLGGHLDGWTAAASCLAMSLVALAEVPGRLPTIRHRAVPWAFYAVLGASFVLLGMGPAAATLAACAAFLLLSQNIRSARFLFNPLGLAILATAIAGRWLVVDSAGGNPAASLAEGGLAFAWGLQATTAPPRPVLAAGSVLIWLPFVLMAVATGLRQGYYAFPFWRLVACWILVPGGLAALGTMNFGSLLAVAVPPLCILAAAGLTLAGVCLGRILRTA